jgi:CheY-like chemotaxis protein
VAEDNIVNQRVALLQLEQMGYAADGVANGIEVLEALQRIPYDVVLMDCHMPEMDGYEAAREIRKREGNSRRTTIIAMTANALEGDRQRCMAAGMDDYITKPVKPEMLLAAIQPWTIDRSAGRLADTTDPSESIEASSAGVTDASGKHPTVIDPSVIDGLRRLQSSTNPDFFNRIVDLFITETPHRLAAMRTALDGSDAAALAHEAHALKGSSANLGARRMNALCEILEEQGLSGSVNEAPVLVSALEEEFAHVRNALEAEKNPVRECAR